MSKELSQLFITLGMDDKGLQKTLNKVQKNLSQAGKVMTGIGAGMMAGFGLATKTAADFDTAMREVNTMMQLGETEFKDFSGQVNDMAGAMGVDATDAAKALYQAISAGVPKENAIEFLQVATRAAIGGVTDTETAVDGLTTVMNAFKMPIEDAQKVADLMFTTVKGGKTTMEELSASMFNVAPLAATAGVKFEEVSAAIATMTKQGVPTAQATTQMRQAIVALMKPTADMSKVLEKLGYDSGEALISDKGLAGALETLREATGGSNEMLGKMFGSVEGLNAVLSLTGANAATFAADLGSMSDSVGASTDAFNQMEQSTSRQMEALKSSFTSMAVNVGDVLLPVLADIVEIIKPIIQGFMDWMKENPGLTKTIVLLAAAIGGVFVVLGPLLMMLPMLAAGFTVMLGPVGLVVAALAGLIAIGVLVWQNWDKVAIFFQELPIIIGAALIGLKNIILAPFRAAWAGIQSFINNIIGALNSIKVNIPSWIPGIGGKSFGINLPKVSLPSFEYGGIVPGPIGQPVPIMAHGGERFLGANGGGGTNIIVNVAGSVITERDLVEVVREGLYAGQARDHTLGFT